MNLSRNHMLLSAVSVLAASSLVQAFVPPPSVEELEQRLQELQAVYNAQFADLHVLDIKIRNMERVIQRLESQMNRARTVLNRFKKQQASLVDELTTTMERMKRVEELIDFIKSLDQDTDPGDNT